MYKVMRCCIFIVIACLFFVGSLDFAEGKPKGPGDRPPGRDKGEKKGWHSDEPPGWEKGEKRGWGSDAPSGLEKKRQKHKDKWDSLTDEERAAKKKFRNNEQEARMAEWKAERDRKRAEWARKREAGEAEKSRTNRKER